MNLDTYERSGQHLYHEFAIAVSGILAASIREAGLTAPQQVQSRAKSASSLRRKLEKTEALAGPDIEVAAKDLAGVRLIFYINSDVERFESSGVLSANFDVDLKRSKVHHPTSAEPEASELFDSNNFVVKLKADRASMAEYSRFAGLSCEVQIQTTLNHAWAEMAHDTIYNRMELPGFGGTLMAGIEARMKAIMRDYLAPAGYAFQQVASDAKRLASGKQLFERGIITAIRSATQKTELCETLDKVGGALPDYDDVDAEAHDILIAVRDAVKATRQSDVVPVQTPFGVIPGNSSKDVSSAAGRVIDYLRFIDIDHTFGILCDLYSTALEPDEKPTWVECVNQLSAYDLTVGEDFGLQVQAVLMDHIDSMDASQRLALMPLVMAVLEKVFSTELTGTTERADAIIIHQGIVTPGDAMRQIRTRALRIVAEFEDTTDVGSDINSIQRLNSLAMVTPVSGQIASAKLVKIVFEDATFVIRRYIKRCGDWPYERRQKVEHELLWLMRRYGKLRTDSQANPDTERARSTVLQSIFEFRDALNADDGFTTYKLLVGYESVFSPAWEDTEFDYHEEEKYRQDAIATLANKITMDNADIWLGIIQRCAETRSEDGATFPFFMRFLEALAGASPEVGLFLLSKLDESLARFLPSILSGLANSSEWSRAEAVLDRWIQERVFLPYIAGSFGFVEKISERTFQGCMERAFMVGNLGAMQTGIRSIAMRTAAANSEPLKRFFLQAVAGLTTLQFPYWVDDWWFAGEESPLIHSLNADEASVVLESVVHFPKVSVHLERLLVTIAKSHPTLVMNYFHTRIQAVPKHGAPNGYERIPHQIPGLSKVLALRTEIVVSCVRNWIEKDVRYAGLLGVHLIHAVFPRLEAPLEKVLGTILQHPTDNDAMFVIEVLKTYKGHSSIHSLCKDIVSSQLSETVNVAVKEVLRPYGMVNGEHGRVEQLKQHLVAMEAWAEDARAVVKSFAAEYLIILRSDIALEQRRSSHRVAMRRLQYDDPSMS